MTVAAAERPAADTPGVLEWRCECGQPYRVSGADRHRIYWPEGVSPRDAVLDGCCVRCRRPLPGKQPHCQEGE